MLTLPRLINGIKTNPKREVRTPLYKMRVVGSGKGKGSYKRVKSNGQKWEKDSIVKETN